MNKNTYIFIIIVAVLLVILGMWQFKNKASLIQGGDTQTGEEKSPTEDDSVSSIDKELESFEIGDVDLSETDREIDSLDAKAR